jgi:hypothetical protein
LARSSLVTRAHKITLGEMRASGVRGLLVYCGDYNCAHSVPIRGDQWPDDVRLSDLEPLFVCKVCGHTGADVRPDFQGARVVPHLLGSSPPARTLHTGARLISGPTRDAVSTTRAEPAKPRPYGCFFGESGSVQ